MKNLTKLFLKSVLCAVLVIPALNSCMDDSALWDKITELEYRLDSLENNLNNQVSALNALMSNGSTISSCKKSDDGSYVIELSNGTKFTVMPEGAKFSSLVSYVTEGGKNYLAIYGPDGALVTLKDASGNPIPAGTSVDVKIEEGVYYLVINGQEYMTGYDTQDIVQIFSSCTPVQDASGQVYAVKFTMGDWEITVTVDGYRGVLFKLSTINTAVLTEYFIDYGATQTFLLEAKGIVDYVMQIPDGWRVKERVEQVTGDVYVDITAPSRETVAMGAAVAAGDLKVVSVVEGGKAAVTRLALSAEPYKVYNVSSARAVVEMYEGVQKYMYGLTPIASFDENQIVTKVNELLASSASLPEGYFLAETPLNRTYEEIYPELNVDESYVFWVVPAIYSEEGEDVGFHASEEMFRYLSLSPVSVSIECKDITLLDAQICVKVKGAASVFAGTMSMKDDHGNLKTTEKVLEEIIYGITNSVYEPISDAAILSYDGPASAFPDSESPLSFDPATEYMSWVVPVETGKTEYHVTDVVYAEYKTLEIKEGGNLQVAVSEPVTDYSSISAAVSSEGAAMICYAYLDKATGDRYSGETISNKTKWNQLNKASTFNAVRAASVEAAVDEILPKTTMWLFAAAVGHDGLYGEVKCVSASTPAYEFNSLTVTVDVVEVGSDEATLKVSVSGGTAEDYLYWVGRTSDPFWVSTCNKSKLTAQQFMAANPDAESIVSVMSANGSVAEDGTLKVTKLNVDKDYVALVLAKDSNGIYSKVGNKTFRTASIDLGADFAAEGSDKWNETKKWIEDNIVWDQNYFEPAAGSGQGSASYAFDIKIPSDLTAYIYCYGTPEEMTEMVDRIVYVENECTRSVAYPKVVYDENGNQPLLPDWYDDNGKLIQGTLLSISTFFVHGDPSRGFVTYFATDGHDDHCPVWTDGACTSYKNYQESIKKYCSIDYWKAYLIDFGNYNHEGDPNNPHSRKLKDEAKINTIAQQYCDIYTKYYKDAEPVFYVNEGNALRMVNRTATGVDSEGNVVDKVTIVLKDLKNNYYAPIVIDVPNYFK